MTWSAIPGRIALGCLAMPSRTASAARRLTSGYINYDPDPELAVLEVGLAFFEEGGHAFLLILEGELGLEYAPLEHHAFGERGFIGAIDRLLDHHDDRERVACDP